MSTTAFIHQKFERPRRRRGGRPREGGTTQILKSDDKTPWTSEGFRTSFGRAVERSGVIDRTIHDLRGTAVKRPAIAGCTLLQIAAIAGQSLKKVHQILDRHYLNRDVRLAEDAIPRLESARVIGAGTEAVERAIGQVRRLNRPDA